MKEPKNRNTRVRWGSEEVARVIDRCAELQQLHPDWSAKRLAEAGQDALPAARRRPVYPPLVAWMNKQLVNRGADVRKTDLGALQQKALSTDAPITARASQGAGDPIVDALVSYGIRAGSSMLMGILRDPGVQRSISQLVSDVLRTSAGGIRAPVEESPTELEDGQQEILLVGLTDEQAREFSRTYRDVLALQFDKGAAITPGLRAAAGRADLIISVERSVASEVSRLLYQINPNYIRHTSGIAGLRQRLADLAMTSESEGEPRGRANELDTSIRRRN